MSIRQIGSGALSVFGIMGLALALISLVEPMVEASDCLRYALQGSVALSQKIHSLILIWTGIRLSSEVITYTLAMFFMFALAATSSGGTHASVHFSEFFSAKMSNNKERHAAMAIFAIIVINCAIALSVFFAKAPSGSFYNSGNLEQHPFCSPWAPAEFLIELG